MTEMYYYYTDGEWRASETGETIEVRKPADTDDVIAEYQQSITNDATKAIEAAAAATEKWTNTPGPIRGGILRETARYLKDRGNELTKLFVREEGKVLSEASAEVGQAINIFYYYAEKTKDIGGRSKQPSGQTENFTRQVFSLFTMTLTAAEVTTGIGIIRVLYRNFNDVDVTPATAMRG
jgi:2,5-dioxopentanoate dehydrogenase